MKAITLKIKKEDSCENSYKKEIEKNYEDDKNSNTSEDKNEKEELNKMIIKKKMK